MKPLQQSAVKLAIHNALYNCIVTIVTIVISFLELGHILTM